MPITIPKPIFLQPRIPSLIVVGLMVAQFLIFGNGNHAVPKCTLTVERPHYSTHLSEYKEIDAIKLNITTICNVPQKYTEISSSIQKIENNRQLTAHIFENTRRYPRGKSPNVAIFVDLYATCIKGTEVAYSGVAKGYVYLQSGQKYPVEGTSGKFVAVSCQIGAQ
jgi:hypothetical protein